MPCTTFLVGKKATNDGSTMISRTDDGRFDEKRIIVVEPKDQPKIYKSKIAKLEIKLPDNPLRYTCSPSVSDKYGLWPATGINSKNVGMTATETLTTNPRVLGGDPYVMPPQGDKLKKGEKPGGIGEEDYVAIVLPYINSAREGVLRIGELLEKYGTYEANGIALNDENEVWWLETIGGHHWIAKRVEDDQYVVMPNQFGINDFDLDDAFGKQEKHLCSKDLKEFIAKYDLDCNNNGKFNPRLVFGSHDDSDHVYNTPRGWYMCRYFNPRTYKWDGENADFTPESDDIPWSLKPERKIAIEEVKYILSSYYQGTEYNPYGRVKSPKQGMYRSIGINRTGVTSICQIRSNVNEEIKGVEWIGFGSNAFNTFIPLYTNVKSMPKYVAHTTLDCDSNQFYWATRLIGALADAHYGSSIIYVERYQKSTLAKARELINKYDELFSNSKDLKVLEKANDEICSTIQKETQKCLNQVLRDASEHMKNGYQRFDN